jgi:ADP-heptose:LPS heptosyltransferase
VKIVIDAELRDFAMGFFKEKGIDQSRKIAVFHTGARKKDNVWPAEKYAELAALLCNQLDMQIVISEGPDDIPYVQKLDEILKQKYPSVGFTRYPGPILNTLAIIDSSDLFVSNDTGIMHLASGLPTPLVAVFGPTKAAEWGPLGEGKVSVQAPGRKIESVSSELVFNECKKLLE